MSRFDWTPDEFEYEPPAEDTPLPADEKPEEKK